MIQTLVENKKVLELRNYYLPCEFSIQVDTFGVSSCNSNNGRIVLNSYGNTSGLSYAWDGPTAIGNIHNPSNLSVGYYAVTVSNTDCSTILDSIPIAGCSNLPVELINFEAKAFNQHALLQWSTATEINNDYFQLEHSIDGKRFKTINRVNGAGTSFSKNVYQYLHITPVKGVNFYRLKQVDFGGLYEYSDVASVHIDDIQFSFYPNPATDRITLISSHESFTVQLRKLDGSIVFKKQLRSTENLDLFGMIAGMYLLEINSEGKKEIHPLIISDPR